VARAKRAEEIMRNPQSAQSKINIVSSMIIKENAPYLL
jgi:hypothetical protein